MIRALKFFVLFVFGVFAIAFSVSNRGAVVVSFNPFAQNDISIAQSELVYELPLYLLVFAVLLMGVLLGGFGAWVAQGKWRQRAREGELQAMQEKLRAQKAEEKAKELMREPDKTVPLLP